MSGYAEQAGVAEIRWSSSSSQGLEPDGPRPGTANMRRVNKLSGLEDAVGETT